MNFKFNFFLVILKIDLKYYVFEKKEKSAESRYPCSTPSSSEKKKGFEEGKWKTG